MSPPPRPPPALPVQRSIAPSSSTGEIGLPMWPFMPALALASPRVRAGRRRSRAMIGVSRLAPSWARTARAAAKPSISGICRSIRIRSNRSQAVRRRASAGAGGFGDLVADGVQHGAHQFAVHRHVVDDQDLGAGDRSGALGARARLERRGRLGADVEGEDRTAVRRGFHGDGAAHQFDQALADRQAQAGAAVAAAVGAVDLEEALEEGRRACHRARRSRCRAPTRAARRRHGERSRRTSPVSVRLDGVADQVDDHLAQGGLASASRAAGTPRPRSSAASARPLARAWSWRTGP